MRQYVVEHDDQLALWFELPAEGLQVFNRQDIQTLKLLAKSRKTAGFRSFGVARGEVGGSQCERLPVRVDLGDVLQCRPDQMTLAGARRTVHIDGRRWLAVGKLFPGVEGGIGKSILGQDQELVECGGISDGMRLT